MEISIPDSWNEYFVGLEVNKVYNDIVEKSNDNEIFPPPEQIFNAFNLFEPNDLKIIIIGQDPYHNPGEANGLSFSVNKDIRIPPSLRNIFKELKDDIGIEMPKHGDLTHWATQGVLLLNNVLTVYRNLPNDNTHKIWMDVTNTLIKRISAKIPNIVFILWGNNAHKKKKYISNIELNNHLILEGGHPSPLNRNVKKNFFGKQFFSITNKYLIENDKKPIDWELLA